VLKPVLDVAVPVLVFLMMVVVGLGLTADDFRRVPRQPRLVMAATIGQVPLLLLIVLLYGRLRVVHRRARIGTGPAMQI
jgi:predicted Na+-dependent transporter